MRPVYGDLPPEHSDPRTARITVLPVPYDGTSTWIKGADRGPERIIEASGHMELYDIETDTEVYRQGIATAKAVAAPADPQGMAGEVRQAVAGLLGRDQFPVVLGGEHSVTIGAVEAVADRYPGLSVLQLDAHTDLRDQFEGSRYNHACVMARVRETCPAVQVGIRSMDAAEKAVLNRSHTFFAHEIQDHDDWFPPALGGLSDVVYITFDLDVLDPSIMPSTGTPEPGGLGWYQVLRFLRAVCRQRRVVGFDVVELCPSDNRAPDFLAAALVYKLLGYIHAR